MKYTIDQNAEEPIMLIDKHIGMDAFDGPGIMGDEFSRELLFLDTLGKKCIQIWINSPGGVVSDGEQIYSTILKTKTKVNTYNIGMCASIAGPIFLAGRNRYMMDFAKFMMHPVAGGDAKSREAFENSVITMLSGRSDMPAEAVKKMMDKTTWMMAQECMDMGICNNIESSTDYNMPRATQTNGTIREQWHSYSQIVNKFIEKKTQPNITSMKKINNRLNLNPDASEESAVIEIERIENRYKEAETRIENYKKDLVTATNRHDALEKELTTIKNKMEEEEKTAKEKKEADMKKNAKKLIEDAVKEGKIKNDAALIEKWTNNAEKDLDGVTALVSEMPIAFKASASSIQNKISGEDGSAAAKETNFSTFRVQQLASYKEQVKNRK